MKKIFLMLALAMTVSMASAWEKRPDEGVFLLAKKHLSPEAKSMVEKYLGESYADDVFYLRNLEAKKQATHSKELRFLHLSADFKSAGVEGEDALKGIEQSLAVIAAHKSYSKGEVVKAFRAFINLMCDMHTIGHIRIESIPYSMQDFKIICYNGDTPKYNKRKHPVTWSRFWSIFDAWHNGMTGAMWANDYEYAHGDKAKQYAAGSLYDWAADCGKTASEIYKFVNPEYEMPRIQRNDLKDLHFEMMAKLGYRLSVMLEELAK